MTVPSLRSNARQSWWDILAIGVAGFVLMLGLLLWLDNVHINTTNGMWKSIFVEEWKADFRSSRLDPSNYLYYPLVALFCRGLDLLGIHADQTWRQLGLISVGFAACALAIVYWLVRRYSTGGLGRIGRGRVPRLAVIDAMAVDGRRRLVLIRRDNVEHLILVGGPSDLVVEQSIQRPRQRPVARPQAAPQPAPAPAAETSTATGSQSEAKS